MDGYDGSICYVVLCAELSSPLDRTKGGIRESFMPTVGQLEDQGKFLNFCTKVLHCSGVRESVSKISTE